MNTPSEDNLLDQSLRDVFRDYDLPPDAHPRVWEGVAERIAALPAPSTGLPYRFLLPLTAVVGVGIGWLLPHPSAVPDARPTAPATHIVAPAPAVVAAPAAVAQLPEVDAAAATTAPAIQAVVQPQQPSRKRRMDVRVRPAQHTQASTPAVLDSASTAAVQAAVTPEVVAQADSAPAVAAAPAPVHVATPLASVPTQQAAPIAEAKAPKPAGTNEKIGYRKLSQRQPEGRRGIGRWFTRFFQGVRHLLS
jgi:hypothetical protein